MHKLFIALILLALTACSGMLPTAITASPCAVKGEASYECQIERYHNINVP